MRAPLGAALPEEYLRGERAVGARVDGHPVDVMTRARLEPHRPIDAAKRPVVAAALGGD